MVTSLTLALSAWIATWFLKFATDTSADLAELSTEDSALASHRLRRRISLKRIARAAYLAVLGLGLWFVHEDVRQKLTWMAESYTSMKHQSAQLHQLAASGLSASPASAASTTPPAPAKEVSAGSGGAEGFVLVLLWGLHLGVLCGFPSFSVVNPLGARPYQPAWGEPKLAQLAASRDKQARRYWDQVQDLPVDLRQDAINATPPRLIDLINGAHGTTVVRVAGAAPPAPAGPAAPAMPPPAGPATPPPAAPPPPGPAPIPGNPAPFDLNGVI
jgi:hypothetical protein